MLKNKDTIVKILILLSFLVIGDLARASSTVECLRREGNKPVLLVCMEKNPGRPVWFESYFRGDATSSDCDIGSRVVLGLDREGKEGKILPNYYLNCKFR